MSLVHSINPCDSVLNRVAIGVRDSRWGLGAGLVLSALAGAPTPLPQISLAGVFLATLAAGKSGGRAAAALGFVSYLVLNRPSAPVALMAGALAVLIGWLVPTVLQALGAVVEGDRASAVSIDCEGFSALDATYGGGAGEHAFRLLQRALEVETRDTDLVVQCEGRELILVLDGSSPAVANSVMNRVERRFSRWLSDAGYECDLSVGLSTTGIGLGGVDEVKPPRTQPQNGPYLD